MTTPFPSSRTPAFDPFGEPSETVPCPAAGPGDRRARRIAIAAFWSLALLITAGRAYWGVHPAQQPSQDTASVAASTTIR